MLHGEVFLPVVGHGLIKGRILLILHLIWLPHPDGLLSVYFLPLMFHFLNLLSLLLSFIRTFFELFLINLHRSIFLLVLSLVFFIILILILVLILIFAARALDF